MIKPDYVIANIKKVISRYGVHIFGWSLFIFYEAVLVGVIMGVYGKVANYAVHYTINISLFYINAHLVLPRALKNPRWKFIQLPAYLTLLMVAYVLFVFSVDSILAQYTNILETKHLSLDLNMWSRWTWRGSYFMGMSIGYYYAITSFKEKTRANKLEKEKLIYQVEHERNQSELYRTQNAFLKAQINPHFLFNTLSFMHSQTQKVAPNVAESILCLSDMMRYSLKNESVVDEVPLTDEIEQVENLINLHQLKAPIPLQIELTLKGDLSDIEILSMLLVTLAENIFKHGILSDPASPARFRLELCNGDLLIASENLVNHDVQVISLNMGVQNITKRLEIKYKDQFSFSHHTDEKNYYHSRIEIKNIACLN